MPTALWWIVHGLTFTGLVACVGLAAGASRRVGARTPYGGFLVVTAVGCWMLLAGFVGFRGHELITGARVAGGSVGDALALGGWLVLTGTFYLFAVRFPREGASPLRRALLPLALGVPAALLTASLYVLVLNPGTRLDTLGERVQLAYLVVDGLAVGVLAAGLERLVRFRASAIGRLFIVLGFGLAMNMAADVMWNWFHHRGGHHAIVDVTYATASVLAMVGLALHYRDVGRGVAEPDRLADPTLRVEQRVLRDLARQLRGLAGDYGESITVATAAAALAREGVAHRIAGTVLEADAPADVWARVLADVRDGVLESVGEGARGTLTSVALAYGPDFAFLAGGRRA